MTRLLRVLAVPLVLAACASESLPTSGNGELDAGAARLHYEVLGNGPDTVVALAGGFGFDHHYLADLLGGLGPSRTVILFDGRRRGESVVAASDTTPLTLSADVADLETVQQHFQLHRFALVAHHSGALVAAEFTRKHPEAVTRLVLLGPMPPRSAYNWDLSLRKQDTLAVQRFASLYNGGLPQRDPREWCRQMWGWTLGPAVELDASINARLAPSLCASPEVALRQWSTLKQQFLTSIAAWDVRPTLAELRQPLLVIQGDRESELVHSGRTWAFAAPEGRVRLVPGSPLFPWVTNRGVVLQAIETFLSGAWPAESQRPGVAEVASPDDSVRMDSATKSPATP